MCSLPPSPTSTTATAAAPKPTTAFRIRLVTFLLSALFLSALPLATACDKKGKPPPGGKQGLVCSDFSRHVTATARNQLAKSLQTQKDIAALDQRLSDLKKNLHQRCMDKKIPAKAVDCVLKLSPKSYPAIRECLPDVDLPTSEDDEGDEDGE